MTLDDIRQLDARLQAAGESLSANRIVQELHVSKRDACALLRDYRASPPAPAHSVPQKAPAPGLPLLVQAQLRLDAAVRAEHTARRSWDDDRQNLAKQQAFGKAQREQRTARGWLDQVERSAAALPTAVAEASKTLLIEESEFASLVETNRRAEAQKARRVQQAREQVQRVTADCVAVVGHAVPAEG
jgi:hypothetical protein